MSELSHYIKLRSGPSGCNAKQFECDKYLDCDSCLEDKIKEHDKQIRADAIDDFVKLAKEHEFKYGKKDISNFVIGFIEFFAEQLKNGVNE